MAVPQAVRNQTQRREEELRAQGIDPNGAPIVPTVSAPADLTPAPAPAPATPHSDEAATLRAENERLKQELSTTAGRVSASAAEVADLKARFELVNGNRTFLETSVTEATARAQELERQIAERDAQGATAQVHSAMSSLDEAGPTEEQKKEFGDSVDFVQRVVRQQLAVIIKPLVAQITEMQKLLSRVKDIDAKLPKLEQTAQVSEINAARMREEQFIRTEVIPHFPDFETVRNTPEWKAYLARDTGRGYTVGMMLKTYRQTNDAAGIRTVIGAFYDQRDAKPSLGGLAVPAKSTADAPETPAPVKMKASEYKANLKAFTSKRMTKADWEAYRARWDQAIAAGNIEMDTELR